MKMKMQGMDEMIEKGFTEMHWLWTQQEEETRMPELTGKSALQMLCSSFFDSRR